MTQTVDEAIEQIESLYKSVTGREVPPPADVPYAAIPPEKDPETHVGEQIDRLLASLSQVGDRPIMGAGWAPPISVWYGTDELLITVDLPGVARDSLRLRAANGVLQISGTRTAPVPGARAPRYAEQPFGLFQRNIPIPGGVAADQLRAQLTEGVLTLRLPKPGGPGVEEKDITVS
jgi:HSP20 family protein